MDGPVIASRVCVRHPFDVLGTGDVLAENVVVVTQVIFTRRDDEQAVLLVLRHEIGCSRRSERGDHLGAPQLRLHVSHEHVSSLEDGDAVLGSPGLRTDLKQRVFYRQRVGRVDECVHSFRIGIEHRARFGGGYAIVRIDRAFQLELPHEDVLLERAFSGELGPSSIRPPPVVVHLEETVLGCGEALSEERVVRGRRAHVRDAVCVAVDG